MRSEYFGSIPATFRQGWLLWLPLAGMLIGGIGSHAAGQEKQPADGGAMEAMKTRVASLRLLSGADEQDAVELLDTALLRYSNPGGETATTDGTIWAWGKAGRPVALAAIFFERLPAGGEKWSCELISLSDGPLVLQAPAGWEWTPRKTDMRLRPVPEAPPVAEGEAERNRQMKDLARRFAVSETFREGQTDQLRLMIRAIHRYADPDRGLIDGALYAFAGGTNPEALLVLEARRDGGTTAWHFGFVRMGAAVVQARLGDRLVWECEAIDRWDHRQAYYSMFGPDAEVFGDVGRTERE